MIQLMDYRFAISYRGNTLHVISIEVSTKHVAIFGQKSFSCQSLAARCSISRCSSNEDYCSLQMETKIPVPRIFTSFGIICPSFS